MEGEPDRHDGCYQWQFFIIGIIDITPTNKAYDFE
jgi:hypothetical protein